MSPMRALCCREPCRAALDDRVRDRIIAETGGNPLALVELSQRMSPSERAGGFAPPAASDLPSRLEERYLRRVAGLPEATQRLMLLAAAEPLGDAALLWRAAERLSTGPGALVPARKPGCSRSTTAFGSITRWCAQRSTKPRRPMNDGSCTTRWRR